MGKEYKHIYDGLSWTRQIWYRKTKKKAMLLLMHQMPLSEWEPKLTKNLRHYLMPKHKEAIVQMNINAELKDLSSTQSWLRALIKAYKTLFCNAEINKKIINDFRGCRCNLQMLNLLFLHCKRSFANIWVCMKDRLDPANDSVQTLLKLAETHNFHMRNITH